MNDMPLSGRPTSFRRFAAAALLALAAAVLSFRVVGFDMLTAYRQTLLLTDAGGTIEAPPSAWRHLSPEARLVLEGASGATTAVARQQAIWTRWPTNRVYFHNTLSAALAHYSTLGTNEAARYRALRALVDRGRPLDPNNARLNWILAAKLMDQACSFKTTVGTGASRSGATLKSEMVVHDRARLDEAMRLLMRGLAQPTYRRYSREMLAERIARLGPRAHTLRDLVLRLTVAAGTLLPDVTVQRNLARGATAYGSLLMAEGRSREAIPYLNAWKPLGLRLNEDAFTLVDVLVVGAIFKEAEVKVPELLRTAVGPSEAGRTTTEIAALTRSLRDWKARRDRMANAPGPDGQAALADRSGLLLAMLLPGIGVTPTDAEIRPGRLLDYVLLDHAMLAGTALILTLGLIVATTVGLFVWRQPETALPNLADAWRSAVRTVGVAVLIPLAVYAIVVWGTPLGGRHYGLMLAWPKAALQAGLAALVILLLLHRRLVLRAGCARLTAGDLPARLGRLGRRLIVWLVAVSAAVSLFPARWLHFTPAVGAALALIPPTVFILSAAGLAGLCAWTWKTCAPHRSACVARVTSFAVPVLALAVLTLNLGARGVLSLQERRLVARDTLLQVDADMGGFTTAEARVARALRDDVLQAATLLNARPAAGPARRR